jgi:hypothetical protein
MVLGALGNRLPADGGAAGNQRLVEEGENGRGASVDGAVAWTGTELAADIPVRPCAAAGAIRDLDVAGAIRDLSALFLAALGLFLASLPRSGSSLPRSPLLPSSPPCASPQLRLLPRTQWIWESSRMDLGE